MNKKVVIFLFSFILLLALFSRVGYWHDLKYGSDIFYHYKIVEDSLAKGHLEISNDHAFCYQGQHTGQSYGFYLVPYSLARFIPLDLVFYALPVLLGLLSVVTIFFFVRHLFGIKTAFITSFLLSASYSFVSKSYPFNYRGDNLIYPLLFLVLFLNYLFLTIQSFKKRLALSILTGVIAGSLIFFWSGYILPLLLSMSSICFYLLYQHWKHKNIKTPVVLTGVHFLVQTLVLYIFFFLATFTGKAHIFAHTYYPFILFATLIYLCALYYSSHNKTNKPIIGLVILVIVSTPFLFTPFQTLLGGFGSIQTLPGTVIKPPELFRPVFFQLYLSYFLSLFLAAVGLIFWFLRLDAKRAYLLPTILVSVYLLSSAVRYLYFASFAIFILAALLFTEKMIIKKKDIIPFIIALFVLLTLIFNIFYALPLTFKSTPLTTEIVSAYDYLRENSPERSCVITAFERAAAPEYFTKRYNYLPSHGNDKERTTLMYNYLLSSEEPQFTEDNLYLLFTEEDLLNLHVYTAYLGQDPIENSYNLYELFNNTYVDPQLKQAYIINETDILIIDPSTDIHKPRFVWRDGILTENLEGKDCFYIKDDFHLFLEDSFCDSHLYKMATGQDIPFLEKVYHKDGVFIYKVVPSFTNDRQKIE